jgi:membrane-associated HD superfamily phosphohydrolase
MALNATIDLTVKKPDFKSMKSEIKELTIQAQQAVMQFGEFSPEARKAEAALASARDRMEDFNDRVKAVNPDKFAQLNTVVSGVARGFQAAQGAMALFGNQSKDLEKTMIKLQGAMALAEGLEGIGKVQQQFGALAGNIKGGVINAFKALGNMSTLAFGVIGVALTLIITNFDTLKKAVMNLLPGLSSMATFVGGLVQKFTDWVGITSAQDRALDKLNKTTGKTNEQLDREIALLQARGDQVGVFNKQRQQLENNLAQARANYGKNTEKEWGKIILDTKNALAILKIEEGKYNAERAAAAAAAEKARLQAIKDAKEQSEKELEEENEKNKKHEQELQDELFNIQGAQIVKNAKQLKAQTAQDIADQLILNEQEAVKRKAISDKATADQLANDAAIKQSKQDLYSASVDLANAVIGLAGEQSKTGKILAVSVIAADTAMALSAALKVSQSPSPDNVATGGLAGAAKYIGLAAMILTNAKKARDILKGGQPSAPSGAGQMSGGGMPQMSAPNISSSLPTVGQFDTKVFVTEGDIRRTSDRVDSTKKVSVVK